MSSRLRRIFAGLLLFCGLFAGGTAWAAAPNCSLKGNINLTVSPCPYTKDFKFGTEAAVSIHVALTGKVPNKYWVLLAQSNEVVQPNTFSLAGTFNSFNINFKTYNKIPSGKHPVELGVEICGDSACKSVLAAVALPSIFDSVVPPAIGSISPSSANLGAAAFTLKVVGGGFSKDCKIHIGSTVLTTTYVSIKQLDAKVSLSTYKKGQALGVTVVPATGIASNAVDFTLNNPSPMISGLSPASLLVGASPFTLTVVGSGFTSSSKISFAGAAITTKYVSSTKLTGTVDLGTAPSGADYAVTVSNPAPGGGASAAATFEWDNAVPAITSISPNSRLVGNTPVTVVIKGSGFQQNSTVQYAGTTFIGFTRQYVSPTEIDLINFWPSGTASDQPITVTTASPGGGTSNGATFELAEPAPSLSWISPLRAYVGSGDVTVTAEGSNFNNDTQVRWNGTPLTIISRFNTGVAQWITATLPAADLATATTGTLSVFAPSPGGGNPGASFSVLPHPPQIETLSPGFVAPGGGDLVLTLDGVDFDPAATVTWGGDTLTPSSVTSTEIQVTVPAADLSGAGVSTVMVVNPAIAGGASAPASFTVDASGSAVVMLPQLVNDLAWDPVKFVFYGSTQAADLNYPESILTVDPITAGVTASTAMDDEPRLLSLSGDGAFLYASFPSTIQRLSTPQMATTLTLTDLTTANGPYYAKSLAASPTMPYGLAATYGVPGATPSTTGVYMYLDAIQTQSNIVNLGMSSVGFSADGSGLYGANPGQNGQGGNFIVINVGSNGIEPFGMKHGLGVTSLWSGSLLHVDVASNLLYADGGTGVVSPVTETQVETLPISGVMAPDSSLGCAYILAQTDTQLTAGANDYTLSCYSTADYTTQTRSIVIPAVNGTPTKMLRWGNEGLAFITDGGYIYFVSGQIVTGN